MNKYKITSLICILTILILEIIPYGAVCNFMGDPETNTILRYTYSYFDLTPFGYANFGPFLTAILSCVLAVLILISIFSKKKLNNVIGIVAILATVTSVLPLLYGLSYYSIIGLIITLLLLIIVVVQFHSKK